MRRREGFSTPTEWRSNAPTNDRQTQIPIFWQRLVNGSWSPETDTGDTKGGINTGRKESVPLKRQDEAFEVPEFPKSPEDVLRNELIQAELRYRQEPSAKSKAEYLRILRIFTDYVLYGKSPKK